jgi:hypothetical protein
MNIFFLIRTLLCLIGCYPFLVISQTLNKPKLVIPYGHHYGIQKSLFANNNELLVTSDEAFTIVSDVRSGKPLYYLNGVNPSVSANGKYIATIQDSFAYVWQTDGGLLVTKLKVNGESWKTIFHPSEPILVVQYKSTATNKEHPAGLFFDLEVWDLSAKKSLGLFESQTTKNKTGCNECNNNLCPIYGTMFNRTGDSLRIIFNSSIQSYKIRQWTNPQTVCLKFEEEKSEGILLKASILSNNYIEVYHDKSAAAFDEFGNHLCDWDKATPNELAAKPVDLVSANGRYVLQYTSDKILLRDNNREIQKTYSANGIKKISFNNRSTYVLIEFLNEMPRYFSSEKFEETELLNKEDQEGFPEYTYVTQTEDAPELQSIFGGMKAGLPKKPKILSKLNKWGVTDIDPYAQMNEVMNGMENETNSSYTNTGIIINLSSRRKISKIQSLIKLTGDISFSPDSKFMLLNTGKVVSVYSIPYARNLINLPFSMKESMAFSSDSRWLTHYSFTFSPDTSIFSIVNLETSQVKNIIQLKKPRLFPEIMLKDGNTKALVQYPTGDYSVFELASGNLLESGISKYHFVSSDGNKMGVYNLNDNNIEISQLSVPGKNITINLPEIKKEKKKKNTDEQVDIYKARFADRSNALIVYNTKELIYFPDMNNIADTQKYSNEKGFRVSNNMSLSPNGKYIKIQTPEGPCIILDTKSRNSSPLVLGEEQNNEDEENSMASGKKMGLILRRVTNGNFGEIQKDVAKFSVTGDSVLACYQNKAILYATNNPIPLKETRYEGEIKYFNQQANLVIEDFHGELKFQKIYENQKWFSMIPFKNGDCVYILPNDIYFGSKSSTRHLGYLSGDKSLSYKQFDFINNRPDIILRELGNTDQHYIAMYDSAYKIRKRRDGIKDIKIVGNPAAPDVIITNADLIKGELTDSILTLQIQIKSPGQMPDRLSVYINGNPVYGQRGLKISKKQSLVSETLRLPLSEGPNNIEISAFDVLGQEGYRRPFNVQYSPLKRSDPKVYFIGLGAAQYADKEKNLSWAKNDITEMLASLSLKYGKNIEIDTIFNQQLTKGKLDAIHRKLSKSTLNDLVIVYYSGHGQIDISKAEAFFGTYDMDFSKPSLKGISMQDFNELTEGIPARNKAIFIDACHSGEINTEAWKLKQQTEKKSSPIQLTPATSDAELEKLTVRKGGDYYFVNPKKIEPFDMALELFTDLYQGNGTNIIAAARGLEAAKECPEFEHGVFTFCALKGMSNLSADEDKNGELSIGELRSFIIEKVSKYSIICQQDNSIQQAVSRKENEFNDWIVINNSNSITKSKTAFILTDDGKEKPFAKGKRIFNEIKKAKDTKDDVQKGSLKKRILGKLL